MAAVWDALFPSPILQRAVVVSAVTFLALAEAAPPVEAESERETVSGTESPTSSEAAPPASTLSFPLPARGTRKEPGLEEAIPTPHRPLHVQPGWKVGSFRVFPDLVISEVYDDNIFATERHWRDDFITIFSPSVSLQSEWSEHRFDVRGGADIGRYAAHEDEDYEDLWLDMDGRYDLTPESNVFGGVAYRFGHESRASPDDVNGAEPTTFNSVTVYTGVYRELGALSARIGGSVERLNFNDVPAAVGRLNNDDRDRTQYTFGGRVSYQLNPSYQLFVQGAGDERRYDAQRDDFGFQRESSGFGVAAGLGYKRGNLEGEAFAGYVEQDYDDSRLADVEEPDFGGRATWRPNARTVLTASLDRTVEETTLPGASAYLNTTGGGNVLYRLSPRTTLTASAAYTDRQYQGTSRDDDLLSTGVGMKYLLNEFLFVTLDYRLLQLDSTDDSESYVENQVMLGLGGYFYPVREELPLLLAQSPAGLPATGRFEGFYTGGQVGYGGLHSEFVGPRGAPGGTLESEFGNDGGTAGLFGGYGLMLNRWYLGAELEAEVSETQWDHTNAPVGRVFSVRKRGGYGGSLRLGYVIRDILYYGRLGVVETEFESDYLHVGTDVGRDTDELGRRFGGGVEIPATDHVFVRFDYTFTDYDDYSITDDTGRTDAFDNAETLFRVGLGWRFGPGMVDPAVTPAPEATRIFGGLYAGGQIGHGALSVWNEGSRADPNYVEADYGDQGATWGVFGGYGHTVRDRWYVGVELEADGSQADVDKRRAPTGRTFGVDKRGSYGVSGRAGYCLADRALLYARVGLVRTEFLTDYATTNTMVEERDVQTGLRYGGGVELPLTERLFTRLDYTYTKYDDYNVAYGKFVDSFDFSESLFRLGVGWRF